MNEDIQIFTCVLNHCLCVHFDAVFIVTQNRFIFYCGVLMHLACSNYGTVVLCKMHYCNFSIMFHVVFVQCINIQGGSKYTEHCPLQLYSIDNVKYARKQQYFDILHENQRAVSFTKYSMAHQKKGTSFNSLFYPCFPFAEFLISVLSIFYTCCSST